MSPIPPSSQLRHFATEIRLSPAVQRQNRKLPYEPAQPRPPLPINAATGQMLCCSCPCAAWPFDDLLADSARPLLIIPQVVVYRCTRRALRSHLSSPFALPFALPFASDSTFSTVRGIAARHPAEFRGTLPVTPVSWRPSPSYDADLCSYFWLWLCSACLAAAAVSRRHVGRMGDPGTGCIR